MELNFVGIVAALVTFLGIAFGHIVVRWLEFRIARLWAPVLGFFALGFLSDLLSLATANLSAKIIFGISGFIFLWDAVELLRQQHRVRRGHAPANPRNPRHRHFLEMPSSSATTIDLLRDEIHSR